MKYYQLLLITIISIILVMGLASASESGGVVKTFGTFKAGDCVRLVQYPVNVTFTKIISILGPNSFNYTSNAAMSKMPSTDEYYYNFCTNFDLGKYLVNGISNENGLNDTWVYDFNVTASGSEYGIYLIMSLLIISVILFIFAFMQKNEYIGFVSASSFIASGVFIMIYGLDIVRNDFTRMLGYIVLFFGFLAVFASIYEMFSPEYEEAED